MQTLRFAQEESIFRAGEVTQYAYVIRDGEVLLTLPNGTVSRLAKGQMFGELSVISGDAASENATAATDVVVEAYSAAELEAMVLDAPPAVRQLVVNLTAKVGHAPGTVGPAEPPISGFAEAMNRITQAIEERCKRLETQVFGPMSADDEMENEIAASKKALEELKDLGALSKLLADDSINDVLINGADNIYVERMGKLERMPIKLESEEVVQDIANKIVKAVRRKLDPHRPLVDARLADGSRVNIIAPPLAVDGTSISIRKFSKRKITLDIMKEQDNMSESLGEFLKICGKCRLNMIISGGTGSGKTTLLNAISQHIMDDERIVTIEDAAELQLQQPHVVRLETRPLTTGVAKDKEVNMRDLVRNALRMRPDRILIGEVRGAEAFDMLQAMNTGHEGSLATIHSNHPRDALSRLENMIGMANLQIPVKSVRYQIASALHLIVQISRMRDGHRRITHVSEIVGMEGEMITMHDLFNFTPGPEDNNGRLTGKFQWSGIMPRFIRRVAYYGEQDRFAAVFGIKFPKL